MSVHRCCTCIRLLTRATVFQRWHRVYETCCATDQCAYPGPCQRARGPDTSQSHSSARHQHQNWLHLHHLHRCYQHHRGQFKRPVVRCALLQRVLPVLLQLDHSAGWQDGQKYGTRCQTSVCFSTTPGLHTPPAGPAGSADHASDPSPSSANGPVWRHLLSLTQHMGPVPCASCEPRQC